ncbi:MAG: hypothetical protein FJZ56_06450 [Chlamydiae bacterium]|nr:hypothetical protein [Chlamydiota bacterium]
MVNTIKGRCSIDFEQMVDRLVEDTTPKKVKTSDNLRVKYAIESAIENALKNIFRIEQPLFNYAILGKDNQERTIGTWRMGRSSGYFTYSRKNVILETYRNDKEFYLPFESILRYQVDQIFKRYLGDLHYNILWKYSEKEFAGCWQYGQFEGFFQARTEIIDQHKKFNAHIAKYDGSDRVF